MTDSVITRHGPTETVLGDPDWRLIAESIPHILWMATPEGQIEYLNPHWTEYTGWPAGATSDRHWLATVHPDDAPRAADAWHEAVTTQTPYSLEYRIRRRDGQFRWHACKGLPVRDAEGRVVRWIGTATDIDDQKRAEAGLAHAYGSTEEALTVLASLHAEAPVGLGFVDRDFRLMRANPELAAMSGQSPEDVVGRPVADVVPDLWARLEPVYRHVLETGEAVPNLPLGERPGGAGACELVGSHYPVRIGSEIIGIGVVVVDITERVRAEGVRAAVMSQVAGGVYAQDRDGRLTYMNTAAEKMLGWTVEELRGQVVHDMVHVPRGDAPQGDAAGCALPTGGSPGRLQRSTQEAFVRKDGTSFPVAYSTAPLHIGSRTEGLVVVFADAREPATFTKVIRVLIADGDTMTRRSFQAVLDRHDGIEVLAAVTTSASAVERAGLMRPDVVLVNRDLPDGDGLATATMIKEASPSTSVILMTEGHDDAVALASIDAGCAGVLDKRRAWVELVSNVRAAYHGETTISQAELRRVLSELRGETPSGPTATLTSREQDVLDCLREGLSKPAIAERLGVTPNTVRNHVQRILYKLNVHSKLEAVVLTDREGLEGRPA